jgi:magnesium-transporting ATPase (P-type)
MNGLTYQAASPDEAALVEAAQKIGFEFYVRARSLWRCQVVTPADDP